MWHTEGLTENIAFVGLYYWEWKKGLSGGNMRFRQHDLPAKSYGSEEWSTFEVECGENGKGKAMVWDNQHLVHRVRMLKNLNKDKKVRKKGYLAFFVVDPENELDATTMNTEMRRERFVHFLYEKVMRKKYGLQDMTEDLCSLIVEYAALGITMREAKRRRKEVIDLKSHSKSKFGYSPSYGNSGVRFYLPMGKAMKIRIYGANDPRPWVQGWNGVLADPETQSDPLGD